MNLQNTSSYKSLNEALINTEAKLHPSEAHGMICGILCSSNCDKVPFKEWVSGGKLNQEANVILDHVYQDAKTKLSSDSFDLELYLPADDETDLAKRAEALTLWCQGFLIGLKLVGIMNNKNHAPDIKEALNDLEEMTKMQYEAVTDSEEDEIAYTELVEYVRMCAMLIHDTLNPTFIGDDHDQTELIR